MFEIRLFGQDARYNMKDEHLCGAKRRMLTSENISLLLNNSRRFRPTISIGYGVIIFSEAL